jgi:hypothetical protein
MMLPASGNAHGVRMDGTQPPVGSGGWPTENMAEWTTTGSRFAHWSLTIWTGLLISPRAVAKSGNPSHLGSGGEHQTLVTYTPDTSAP